MSDHIVVVGAGIAGLATAVALQESGRDVVVLDDRDGTSAGYAITLWPNALAACDALGIGAEVRDAGARVEAGKVRWHDGRILREPANGQFTAAVGEPVVVTDRNQLLAILADRLAPGTVRYGARVSHVRDGLHGTSVELADGHSLTAAAVIGADGIGSLAAQYLNGPLAFRYSGYTAWRGIADITIPDELAGITVGPGIEFGHLPLSHGRTYWFAAERSQEARRAPDGEIEYLAQKFGAWAEPIPDVLSRSKESSVLRGDVYDRGRLRRIAGGRVVLVGDAAHPMRPHLGQGGCQSLEDAAVLSIVASERSSLPSAFREYARRRRSRTRAVVNRSRQIGHATFARPAVLSGLLTRASARIPAAVFWRQLGNIAGYTAGDLAIRT
ncbi:FAD-dependent oxidoreductase [Mycobacteroides franklinii]|uniref:FAD-dependent urate hydroxylase n=1 Tax=Mycobacteroides franklinii TaxID=948102 RepID=A0A4R8R822_9MYCO|nr:FAD-dependent oxidoreductase [Mycobacteroides franklinii]TDZ42247.1 FAD-dependent urate hydroxylase [Mycobacteroides franklinii]TDZ52395.1 FAD-dependent urate hydroxylase [Mycobacteroides franklinii]TDZ55802.1 FAD-dependent urate hydroxylase [Mycobacteroides franklinii]TDZ62743.1 FAD-dependent urate hydroxylase [Mycobacteroides franklinii]TDZ69140.1 FAD-dependent urate hydroxylase [Mycobacteroides franklinii]